MSTNDDWKIRVEYAIRTFRSPFVEDIRLSSIATDRELSYLAGQTLAAECLNLQAALTEAREVIEFCKKQAAIPHENCWAILQPNLLWLCETIESKASAWLEKWGK